MSSLLAAPLLLLTMGAPAQPSPDLRLEPPADAAVVNRVLLDARADDAVSASAGPRPEALRRWGQALRLSTAGALVAASTLGTMAAINQPTRFGDGRCLTGGPVLGEYGCDRGLSTLHGSAGVLSAVLYTANGVLGLAAPESRGHVAPGARPVYRALTGIHLGGIIVQPILGLVAAFPQVIGRSRSVPTDTFPRNLRTAHVIIGYVTTAAFLTTVGLEW
jgi:hypothetical protein